MTNCGAEDKLRSRASSGFRVALSLLLPQPFGLIFLLRRGQGRYAAVDRSVPLFVALGLLLFASALLGYVYEGKGWTYGLKIAATVSACLAAGYYHNRISADCDLSSAVRLAGVIHLLILMLEFFLPHMKVITVHVSRMDPSLKLDVSYRLSGFFDGFDIAGVFLGVCALSEAFNARFSDRGERIKGWFFILSFAVGSILCSRTGIIISMAAMACATFRNPLSILPNALLIGIFLIFAMSDPKISETIYFMFDIVFNYLGDGDFSNTSSRDLIENNWFVPAYSVFGNGGYPWSGGVDSDVAYVQVLPILGFVGALLFAALYLVFFVLIIKRSPAFWWLVPVIAIASLKGAYFWSPPLLLLCAFATFKRAAVMSLEGER